MDGNYLNIDGRYYAINIDKVIEFISEDSNSVQSITQSYGIPFTNEGNFSDEFKLISKEVSETKEPVNENMSNLRYSLLTYLLNIIMAPLSDGTGNVIVAESMKTLHLGQVISFNTLFAMGIIYEIDDNE